MKSTRPAFVVVLGLSLGAVRCGNSSASPAQAADPIAPTSTTLADATFVALANGTAEAIVEASFAYVAPGADGCTSTIVAGCIASTCTAPTTPAPSTALDPGALTATSTTLGTSVAVPMTHGVGRVVVEKNWPAGEQVTLDAAGGADFPAFSATVTIPPAATSAAIDGCSATTEAAACALSASGATVTWQGGAGAVVTVALTPSLDTATQRSVTCQFTGDGGAGHLPAAAIATLDAASTYGVAISARSPSVTTTSGAKYTAATFAERIFSGAPIVVKTPG